MKQTIEIVALSVDNVNLVLYKPDGSTVIIPQGDARVPRIVEEAKNLLQQKQRAWVDITPVLIHNVEYENCEQGTNGLVRFFRVAKSALKSFINTESPKEVPKEVEHIRPMDIGVFPGTTPAEPVQVVEVPVTKPEIKTLDIVDGVVPALTNDQKLAKAREKMDTLLNVATPASQPTFHTPMKENETIIAVVNDKVIPDAHKLQRQLRAATKLKDYSGFQKFLERLSTVVDRRGHSVEDLMKFMETGDLPIADDGSIVIYKRLNKTRETGVFKDCHTGRVKQKVGSFVFMREGLVDPNRRQDCSNGLHVATLGYLQSFNGDITVIAKVRPEDVIAVPEYSSTKMRVCGYHIIAQLTQEQASRVNNGKSLNDAVNGKELLNAVLRGKHIGITQHVEIGGQQGTKITITDLKVEEKTIDLSVEEIRNESLDMEEDLTQPVIKVEHVKATDLVKPEEVKVEPATKPVHGTKLELRLASTAFMAANSNERMAAAVHLVALKKKARKSWKALGYESVGAMVDEYLASNKPAEDTLHVTKTETFDAVKPAAKCSRNDHVMQIYKAMVDAPGLDESHQHAKYLVELKRKAKVSWIKLGITDDMLTEINKYID